MSEDMTGTDLTTPSAVDSDMSVALFEIASEVSVLRDRLSATEELLREAGTFPAGAIDAYEFSAEASKRCDAERADFVNRILLALAGRSTASPGGGAGR